MKKENIEGENKNRYEDLPHAHIYFHPYSINHGT